MLERPEPILHLTLRLHMQPVYLRNVPPPAETFEHINLLQWFAGWVKPERYLELGVRDGRCFAAVAPLCTEAIAVDCINPMFSIPSNATYKQMYTDEYFKSIYGTDIQFDMVFIDADHSFEQSYQDFLNVKDYVIDDGFVFFHDTYPCNAEMTAPHFSHNCYKTPIEIKKNFSTEWELVTLPFNPGVTIAKKVGKKDLPWMS
jgi:hypothetical protein